MFTNEELLEIKRMINFYIWKGVLHLEYHVINYLILKKINEYIAEKKES